MSKKNQTPEQKWDEAKKMIFKDDVPADIEELVKQGLNESKNEDEKFAKLAVLLIMIQRTFR